MDETFWRDLWGFTQAVWWLGAIIGGVVWGAFAVAERRGWWKT